MENVETDSGATRNDLLQRIELMEEMIVEGRRSTTRLAWICVLWGVVDLVAMGWRFLQPSSHWVGMWAWPICLIAGALLTVIGLTVQKQRQELGPDRGKSTQMPSRSVEAVWAMMGVALAIYIGSAMVSHFSWQVSYIAGILMMVGMAHAISAVILRWRVQGVVAAIWWAGGVAMFFDPPMRIVNLIMLLEMCLGMIAFGLYAMMRERRNHV
jgi:fatty acid desaturase